MGAGDQFLEGCPRSYLCDWTILYMAHQVICDTYVIERICEEHVVLSPRALFLPSIVD